MNNIINKNKKLNIKETVKMTLRLIFWVLCFEFVLDISKLSTNFSVFKFGALFLALAVIGKRMITIVKTYKDKLYIEVNEEEEL